MCCHEEKVKGVSIVNVEFDPNGFLMQISHLGESDALSLLVDELA